MFAGNKLRNYDVWKPPDHRYCYGFSYRKKNRERPIIGDRRPPSKLGDIQPDHWLAEYTTELINVLHVLALLVEMEPDQAKLLEAICGGPTLDYSR